MGILNYKQVLKSIPIESILDVNTFLMCSTWNISTDFEELTSEVVEKTKKLRTEKQAKKHELLEKIEEKLPQGVENQELRAAMLKAYLDEHGAELVAEAEQFTLNEIRTETELFGTVKSSKMSQFLRNYVEAEQTSEEFERNAEAGICKAYTAVAEGFNHMMIPGYSAYASGGDAYEVVSSAGSDIVLTLVGGKVVKMAWTGSKALYQGAKNLGHELCAINKVQVVERTLVLKQRPNMNPLDFEKKVTAQIDLSERGKNIVTKEVIRDGQLTVAKRNRFSKMAQEMYKDNPKALEQFESRLKTKDVDHMHELQLGGDDHPGNMVMIDSAVNRSIGKQIHDQIKDLPEGAVISKVIVERLKK